MSHHNVRMPLKEDQEIYQLFRSQIVSEDNLANHRMTWLIVINSFLLALLLTVFQAESSPHMRHAQQYLYLICATGLSAAIFVGAGIVATQITIKRLVSEYEGIYNGKDKLPKHLPALAAGELANFLGLVPLVCVPLFCVILWCIMFHMVTIS